MQTQNYGTDTAFSDQTATDAPVADAHAKLDQAASKAHDTVDRMHRKASAMTDRVTTQGDRMYGQACDWVSEHPMQAVAGALFVGYLFGKLRS